MSMIAYLKRADGYAFETVTVSTVAKELTQATYEDQDHNVIAHISVEAAQIRYRYDGSDPTSLVGHIANIGDEIYVEGYVNVGKFRAIRTGSTDSSLQVTYERA